MAKYLAPMPNRSSRSPSTICWRSAAAIRTTHRNRSTWPIWPSAAAARSTASADCTARSAADCFSRLFPRWPRDEVPVAHVTNGVHMPTWDSADADELWEVAAARSAGMGTMDDVERRHSRVLSDADLWQLPDGRSRVARSTTLGTASPASWRQRAHQPRKWRRRLRIFDPQMLDAWVSRGASRPTNARTCCCTTPIGLLRILTNPTPTGAARGRRARRIPRTTPGRR